MENLSCKVTYVFLCLVSTADDLLFTPAVEAEVVEKQQNWGYAYTETQL